MDLNFPKFLQLDLNGTNFLTTLPINSLSLLPRMILFFLPTSKNHTAAVSPPLSLSLPLPKEHLTLLSLLLLERLKITFSIITLLNHCYLLNNMLLKNGHMKTMLLLLLETPSSQQKSILKASTLEDLISMSNGAKNQADSTPRRQPVEEKKGETEMTETEAAGEEEETLEVEVTEEEEEMDMTETEEGAEEADPDLAVGIEEETESGPILDQVLVRKRSGEEEEARNTLLRKEPRRASHKRDKMGMLRMTTKLYMVFVSLLC